MINTSFRTSFRNIQIIWHVTILIKMYCKRVKIKGKEILSVCIDLPQRATTRTMRKGGSTRLYLFAHTYRNSFSTRHRSDPLSCNKSSSCGILHNTIIVVKIFPTRITVHIRGLLRIHRPKPCHDHVVPLRIREPRIDL